MQNFFASRREKTLTPSEIASPLDLETLSEPAESTPDPSWRATDIIELPADEPDIPVTEFDEKVMQAFRNGVDELRAAHAALSETQRAESRATARAVLERIHAARAQASTLAG